MHRSFNNFPFLCVTAFILLKIILSNFFLAEFLTTLFFVRSEQRENSSVYPELFVCAHIVTMGIWFGLSDCLLTYVELKTYVTYKYFPITDQAIFHQFQDRFDSYYYPLFVCVGGIQYDVLMVNTRPLIGYRMPWKSALNKASNRRRGYFVKMPTSPH